MQLDQLIVGCKKQKADCQKLLYKNYYNVLMSICTRYATTTEDAEEMFNNGFLKIFVHINQFEGKGSFEGWMKKTMVNTCLDFLKSKHIKSNVLSHSNMEINANEDYFDSVLHKQGVYDTNASLAKWNDVELQQLFGQLPTLTKTVFNLYVFENYSHKEISSELGIAERTSQWHVSNAKKILIDALQNKNIKIADG